MCNVEDSGDKTPVPRGGQRPAGSKCVKCDEPGVLVTRIHDPFCKACFQVYVVHKFRSAIGKSKLIRDGEKVLVAFSGGTNSSALLHLIQDGLSMRAHKRLRFTPTLLHIDESGLVEGAGSGWQGGQDKVKQKMLNSGFPSYWTFLEQSLNACHEGTSLPVAGRNIDVARVAEEETPTLTPPQPEQTEKLRALVASMGNPTAREDFVRNLRLQLLVVAARQLGFTKVLTAETSTRLAVRILAGVAQGRGSQVSLDTGISDERNKEVMIMRPVRDLNAKELAMYNNLFGVESVFTPTLTTRTALASSIERLTETFVTGLQSEFPSTVSNIVRTSEKLGLPNMKGTERCTFCQSPLDTDVGKASALAAVVFSQQMSGHTPACSPGHQTNGVGAEFDKPDLDSELDVNSLDALNRTLCYGCRLSLHNFTGDVCSLPPLITRTAPRTTRERQREQLSGFLLDDAMADGDFSDR